MILHSQDKPFKCTYCEEHFKSRFARLKHQEKFHLGKQINFSRSSIATIGGHVMLEEAAAVESLRRRRSCTWGGALDLLLFLEMSKYGVCFVLFSGGRGVHGHNCIYLQLIVG